MFISAPSNWSDSFSYNGLSTFMFVFTNIAYWLGFAAASIIVGFFARRFGAKPETSPNDSLSMSLNNKGSIRLFDRYRSKGNSNRKYSGDFYETSQHLKNQPLRYIESILSWLAWFTFACIPVWLTAFGQIPLWAGILIVFVLFFIRLHISLYANCPFSATKDRYGYKKYKKILSTMLQLYPKRIFFGLIFLAIISTFMNIGTYQSCVNDHADNSYGIQLMGGKFIYSSAFTRYVTLHKVCPPGPPCHVYATLPFDTSSSVFINVHTHVDVMNITVSYDTVQNAQMPNARLSLQATSSYMISPSGYDMTGERNIHTVLLTGLLPDQEYSLEVYYSNATQYTTIYQTLPSEDSTTPYTLVYGGDLGPSAMAKTISSNVAQQNPRAMIIGGDLAYDNGLASCYYTMDLTLQIFEQQIYAAVNRLVPFIVGVGNHDVGFQSLSDVTLPAVTTSGPSYYTLFPQNLPTNSQGVIEERVAAINERVTYHAHMIGNMLNVVLDSGYMEAYDGTQLAWLQQISEDYKNYTKIGMYHDPIMSPCYYFNDTAGTIASGLLNWIPIFDEYNYMAVFEHHTHTFKRTFPIRGMVPSDNGTIYFGDGAWGVNPTACTPDNSTGIYASYGSVNHAWIVNVDPATMNITYQPIGSQDTFIEGPTTQNMNMYSGLEDL